MAYGVELKLSENYGVLSFPPRYFGLSKNDSFWYSSVKACMKCSNVPSRNLTTSLRQYKFQELQVISAGKKLHKNISSFQAPSHKIVRAHLFLTASSFPLQPQASHYNDFNGIVL